MSNVNIFVMGLSKGDSYEFTERRLRAYITRDNGTANDQVKCSQRVDNPNRFMYYLCDRQSQ